ncbi:MAG: hypothetical protein N4R12_01420 [Lactobacillus crispatus]|uniref:hypothetical protein n=1 Tax=Lactobacillus crispatus TaxID=47770 RepID=UPI0021BDEEBD|nr:hypothetical protein [Lactobacillus crispatus]MCT7820639.1 hypothetical protein [Lactobacillus crispatus]
MNLGITIIQSLNQLKFTVIVVALLILFIIFDFHAHLKKSNAAKSESVYLNWDNSLNKAVLVICFGKSKSMTIALTQEQFATLRHDFEEINDELHNTQKNLAVDVLNKVKHSSSSNKKTKVEIPLTLLKKYQADERKLTHFEHKIASKKAGTRKSSNNLESKK